ncbi:GNAT family N-acetyltransferase [Fredinandcohnia humi]
MQNAEKEARLLGVGVVEPIHLLIACLNERTGALGEITSKTSITSEKLRSLVADKLQQNNQSTHSNFLEIPKTDEVSNIMETAVSYMKKYKQIYLNEGHLLKALLRSKVIELFVSVEDRKMIEILGTTSRDMITHLGNYTFTANYSNDIRRATSNDRSRLVQYVETHFSKEWAQTIENGFQQDEPTVYIAFDEKEEIIGFATFDVYKKRKCYFGPMGVTISKRTKGIGYSLLHHCLKDMSEIGYEYAIIGGAGPLEFYEKACNAVVIPSTLNPLCR